MAEMSTIMHLRVNRNAFANLIGLEATELLPGYCRGTLPVREDLLNPIGSVHGGLLFTAADTIGGTAACSNGWVHTTLDSSFHFLRPAMGIARVDIEANVIKNGKRVVVCEVKVADEKGAVLAEGIFTYVNMGVEITGDGTLLDEIRAQKG